MNFKTAVFYAATYGNIETLKNFLDHRREHEVEGLVGAKTNGATPLVMACRNGHYEVAEYLIEKCGADVEQPGSVVFDGETIESAPPLWCAAAAGHFSLVKLLIKHGAKVNSTTKTSSTPLRAASFDGHLNIVKYLVLHGADIEKTNRHGHTCLMIACFRGQYNIVKFLLSMNADVNRKSAKGNTALHDCAESGSLEILKLLVSHGAKMETDFYGMTPLLAAAVTGHAHVVKYLIEIPHMASRKERIDAFELLGATYVDKKHDMIGALEFWKQAMDERYEGSGPVIHKTPLPPVAAYDFAHEISNPNALDDLLADPDEMRMQALMIRERILGPAHPDTSYYIRYRGASYADAGKIQRCIKLWNYALDMQQRMFEPLNPTTQNSFFSFTELFIFSYFSEERQQSSRGRRVPIIEREELLRVFKKAVLEVSLGKKLLDDASNERDLRTHLNRVLVITVHLAYLLTYVTPRQDSEEYETLLKALFELVRINAKGNNGRDVLLITHSKEMLDDRFPQFKFPSPQLTQALLKVGADVTACDDDGNTVLHLTALTHHPWCPELRTMLLDAGAHFDAVNNDGKTFTDLMANKLEHNPLKYTTLTCLAARVVRRTKQMRNVPRHLHDFVQRH